MKGIKFGLFCLLSLLLALNSSVAVSIVTGIEIFSAEEEESITTTGSECDSLLILWVEALSAIDSLQLVIIEQQNSAQSVENNYSALELLKLNSDSLQNALTGWMYIVDTLSLAYSEATTRNKELMLQVITLQTKIDEQNKFLEDKQILLLEKELIIKEKEDIYKSILTGSQIDLLKLEGKLNAKEQELLGKSREIDLLSAGVSEKQKDIEKKNEELAQYVTKKEVANKMIDSLRDSLHSAEKAHILLVEENKYAQKEIADLKARLAARDKRDKQVAIVQGVALRTFRTPLYILAPKSTNNPDNYVITNENAGSVEFDLLTGASVRIMRLSSENATYKFDLGWFVGFGGNNIFKNFYLGPNVKLFDFIHVNTGINFAEFRVLKDGFKEGADLKIGTPISTVNKWKPSYYLAITFDFELITQIVSKF